MGEPERAGYVLGEATALWRGSAFVELDGWDVGRVECERLDELRRDAEELGIEAELRAGRARAMVARAQALVSQAPLRERRWCLLALAQYQAGRQSEALRSLREVRRLLGTELGLDPGPEIVALEEAILRQDRRVSGRRSPTVPAAHVFDLHLRFDSVQPCVQDSEAARRSSASMMVGQTSMS